MARIQGVQVNPPHLPPPYLDLRPPHRWLVSEGKSWSESLGTCSLPRRVFAQRQELTSSRVWLLSRPRAHATDSAEAEDSARWWPQPPSRRALTGFRGQPGLGSSLSFQTMWLIALDWWPQSLNLSYPHLKNGASPKLWGLTKVTRIKRLATLPAHSRY